MISTFILNAEDSEPTRELIKELLESTGEDYIVQQVKNGIEFNERLSLIEFPIDIAILDIHMPDFDIISAVDKLWRERKQTYVIVSSTDDNLDVILQLQNIYHIWGYVLKGDTKKDFGEELKKLVYDAHTKVQDKNQFINKQISYIIQNGANKY